MRIRRNALSIGAGLALTAMLVTASTGMAAPRLTSESRAVTTVTLMTWETPATNALIDSAMAGFMKLHPTIKVQRINTPAADFGQKLTSRVVAHQLPDLFWAGNDTEQQYAQEGLLYDWTKYAQSTHTSAFDVKNFAPSSLTNWSVSGHLYGLPSLMNTYGVWYNVAAFKAAGLPLPTVGWTYQDMMHDAQVLTAKATGSGPHYGLVGPPDDPFSLGEYSMSAGGAPFQNDIINPTKVTASPQFIQGVTMYQQAIAKGYVSPPNYDTSNSPTDFAGGKIPMLYGGQWLCAAWLLSPLKFQYGFAPVPIVSKRVQPYDAVGIVSAKNLSNPDAVWQVLQYLDTTAWQSILVGSPVAPAAYVPASTPYFNKLKAANLTSVANAVNYELTSPVKAGIRFLPTWASKAQNIITAQWSDILLSKTDATKGSLAMASALNQLISQQKH